MEDDLSNTHHEHYALNRELKSLVREMEDKEAVRRAVIDMLVMLGSKGVFQQVPRENRLDWPAARDDGQLAPDWPAASGLSPSITTAAEPMGGSTCGNSPGCGTVFRISPTSVLTTIYSFCSQVKCL